MQFENEFKGQVYFPLEQMDFIQWLSEEEIKELKLLTTVRYDYSKVVKFFENKIQQVA